MSPSRLRSDLPVASCSLDHQPPSVRCELQSGKFLSLGKKQGSVVGQGQDRAGPPKNTEFHISRNPPILSAGGRGHTWEEWPGGEGTAASREKR